MKTILRWVNPMPFLVTAFFFSSLQFSFAQSIFDANYNNFNFLAANKVHKVGTDGSGVGNITLYTNVITIGAQQIDCIVTTVSLTGGTFTLPGTPGAGTIPFDYSATTGAGMTANADRFFSPTFSWSSAGSCRFRFQFILGGSYNNGTNTGTPVILQNVYVNTYDIDGNGSANSNQNNEFSAFNTAQYKTAAGGLLVPSYNSTTGFTRFRSNTTTNTTAVVDDNTRLRIGYNQLSTLEIIVGADGGGAAYYFLDLGQGPAWTSTPPVISTPVLDLSTTSGGLNNNLQTCLTATRFTEGLGNITGSTNAVTEMEIQIPAAEILDGNSEVLLPTTPTGVTDSIRLGTPFTGTQSVVLGGVTYQVARSVSGGIRTILITPTSGTFTTAQAEAFLDELRYINRKTIPSAGNRNFSVTMRENFLKMIPAIFQMTVNCGTLPVTWLSFTATRQATATVLLSWRTTNEVNAKDYLVQYSTNSTTWSTLSIITANNSNAVSNYQFTHATPADGANFYRIVQRDIDGRTDISIVRQLLFTNGIPALQLIGNTVTDGKLQLRINEPALLQIIGSNGQVLLSKMMSAGTQSIDVSGYASGIYHLRYKNIATKLLIQ
ncbi:MAG: hypothetical protein IPK90_14880 [Chitinophagaceae bacterium]|nr:hypothetical protein [Chitinophagaceae bacterium]MBK9661257.1 hypothetical protein [Chitinophagaceae bacterium]